MTGWARLHVSYCQYEVTTVPGVTGLGIHTIGDTLLQVGRGVGSPASADPHGSDRGTSPGAAGALDADRRRLDAISEATLWSPSGRLSVIGLMGGVAEALVDVA
ncbi:hypothetical protein, partial [Micromonospora sp. b486]|uniref:hypothetical protein n=1 Tax=Micromonospora sp. b486 TaxID=3053986 RepID=UPI00259C99AA